MNNQETTGSRDIAGRIRDQAELLHNRLTKRYRHLKKWARRTGTNAFRLYDRDIPEIPLVLDLYGDAVSGAMYRRSSELDERWLPAMKDSISRALGIEEDHIFLKERFRMKNRQETGVQYNRITARNFYQDVTENDMIFRVNLSDYLDTGLFLDARKKRLLFRSAAAGKKILNLFAYTSTLSVAAAKGNAARVDSVDMSNTYLDWGKVNFALNKLDVSDRFSFIRSDVIQFISQALKMKSRWDEIILDPPSFSNSKKMKGTLDIRRDFRELIQDCLSLLNPGGTLWFSSNARGFVLEPGLFDDYSITDMGPELADEDFRSKRIPVCYTLTERTP